MFKLVVFLTAVVLCTEHASGHGRLMHPPGRSTMWRFGFDNEPNYTDMGLNCGGISTQYNQNGGKCGICGDNYADPTPRENELGGKYGKSTVVETYRKGESASVWVELTASHKGHFEFGLCDLTKGKETEECFKPLTFDNGAPHFEVPTYDPENFTLAVRLPGDVVCERCVLRWHYKGGNNVGTCADGSSSVDCADQEVFRACADITIH